MSKTIGYILPKPTPAPQEKPAAPKAARKKAGMTQKELADKLGIPREKMPSNIVENFGNASGATIPTNIGFNLGDRLMREQYVFCLAGFGVGLTWGALLLNIGNLSFNEIIYY